MTGTKSNKAIGQEIREVIKFIGASVERPVPCKPNNRGVFSDTKALEAIQEVVSGTEDDVSSQFYRDQKVKHEARVKALNSARAP
jgi:hypothetical protein